MNKNFDVIVVGAGHAGCEAALAAARLNKKVIVFATNLDTVAYLACNPSIGGTAKGNIVKEIDALGGQMALIADKTAIQIRMLNRGKGPAVHSPRAQVDKHLYHLEMKKVLESTENLFLRQAEIIKLITDEKNKIIGVKTNTNLEFFAPAIILATGVYLNSKIIIGEAEIKCGPNGFASADKLSDNLVELGFSLRRFKTGTPARINARSVDFTKMECQKGDENMPSFSFLNKKAVKNCADCYLTWSTEETKQIIKDNLYQAPVFTGAISGKGPRYCPSIEDKVVRFADKERHQVFLERESMLSNEIYVQGASSSFPAEVQLQMYKSIKGLEGVEIMRDAYAIEYDCFDPLDLLPSLMTKTHKGLFFAGQINGTSGYEEAAAQGLVAGINAARFLDGLKPYVPDRASSYIGVLIDDLTSKGTDEPYRMMTGRAEYRLLLRQDNADIRLTQTGRDLGLVTDQRYKNFRRKTKEVMELKKQLNSTIKACTIEDLFKKKEESVPENGIKLSEALKRNNIHISDLTDYIGKFSPQVLEQCEIDIKYEGYIERQKEDVEQFLKMESKILPNNIDYHSIKGLRLEARQKLDKIRPENLGQASRISGVSPADVTVLIVWLAQNKKG